MIFFDIDGDEYTVEFSATEVPNSVPFTTPAGVTYWMEAPKVAQ